HGYNNAENRIVTVTMAVQNRNLTIQVQDDGVGIADIAQAMEPAFSTREEHMGLGFVFMQTFMDDIDVFSEPGEGTTVIMHKKLPASAQPVSDAG
ncbi:MAG: ATP-binding protein, partial [Peptococcaceae bacterium]|nr:ATP-binding protein [Peptococcaceae bacterium]